MFIPAKISLPPPSLVRLLVELLLPEIIPVIDTSPTPPNVNPALFAMFPVKVNVPELISVFILEAAPVVIVPDKVAAEAPVTNLIAPVLLIPVPLIVMDSGIAVAPLISIAALDPTNVPCELVLVPNASFVFISTIPAVMDVVPAYVFVLEEFIINLPSPSLFKLLVEVLLPVITPLINTFPAPPNVNPAVFETPPFMVKVPVPEATSVFILAVEVVVVITPDKVVVPVVLGGIHIAPLPTPFPVIVNGSVIVNPVPTIFTAAPEPTVVVPLAVPKADALVTLITPLLTVVKPV